MSFQVSVLPSNRSFTVAEDEPILTAGIRQGVALPYGCKDGACGSCKCKMLEGKVVHGAHQPKALSAEEEQSDIVLESRQVTSADAFPIKRMPSRVISLEKKSHDVITLKLQLPASDTLQYKAGQYIEFILRDGARRSYSMASAPHIAAESKTLELHIRHTTRYRYEDSVDLAQHVVHLTPVAQAGQRLTEPRPRLYACPRRGAIGSCLLLDHGLAQVRHDEG
ncbi:MAG: CDP-6-deoxy-L-threo-D-glycero-4-hexulose-3-dehydrase reductase [Pseudomonadota bacterium]